MTEFVFTFKGQSYLIPEGRRVRAIAAMEKHLTIGKLARLDGDIPVATLALAFHEAIAFVGARVSESEVLDAMRDPAVANEIAMSVISLFRTMLPKPTAETAVDGADQNPTMPTPTTLKDLSKDSIKLQ